MARRIDHVRLAKEGVGKAAIDGLSMAIPEIGKVRSIAGVVGHASMAGFHTKKAIQKNMKTIRRKVERQMNRFLG